METTISLCMFRLSCVIVYMCSLECQFTLRILQVALSLIIARGNPWGTIILLGSWINTRLPRCCVSSLHSHFWWVGLGLNIGLGVLAVGGGLGLGRGGTALLLAFGRVTLCVSLFRPYQQGSCFPSSSRFVHRIKIMWWRLGVIIVSYKEGIGLIMILLQAWNTMCVPSNTHHKEFDSPTQYHSALKLIMQVPYIVQIPLPQSAACNKSQIDRDIDGTKSIVFLKLATLQLRSKVHECVVRVLHLFPL